MGSLRLLALKMLPKKFVSKVAGKITNVQLPPFLLQAMIQIYCRTYKVDLFEVRKAIGDMSSFGEFFTRELKKGTRPIHEMPNGVVSPCDGKIIQLGPIENGLLIQTKNVFYSLRDLVGQETAATFQDGFFLVIYLSPADYHRFHYPADGTIKKFSYFSGTLWPVNPFAIESIPGVFCQNERIVTPLETARGTIGLVKVGAFNVGKISVSYTQLTSNTGYADQENIPLVPEKKARKGEELGMFHLGSTIIVLFEKDSFRPEGIYRDKRVKMGELLGVMKQKTQGIEEIR